MTPAIPSSPSSLDGLDTTSASALLHMMIRIRVFEERVQALFLAGDLPGFVHTYLGQEAIASAVCASLGPEDFITSTHRGHGHGLAKGMTPDALMAELFGKITGANRGRGGSMHVADFSLGMLGANGIVGGGFGIAAGAGLSAKLRQSGQVAVCFFGDGATNKGTFHEALNFASVHKLPVVYVCENNHYAQFTSISRTSAVSDLAERAASYAIPGTTLDGNDAGIVHSSAASAIASARNGQGPSLLNYITYRHSGHYVGDAEVYRDADEVAAWKRGDPISRLESALRDCDWLTTETSEKFHADAHVEVESAVRKAQSSPYPDSASALDYVYTEADQCQG